MRLFAAGIAAVLCVAAAVGTATASRSELSPWVSLDGVGGVVPGMTGAQVHALWGIRVPPAAKPCGITNFGRGRLHGYALFLRGRFGAVFFDRGASTTDGVRIGSTLSLLVDRYGSALRGVPGARTFFVTRPSRPHWQLRFDVDGAHRVRRIGFGDASVHFVGGCGY